ncbi:MAG: OsmC family protein [Sphaerochaeta sp.]|jgi:putative redox protein|nr:OsmC family protein [Sphaerochaeta sp.]MCI2045692.1 OsmC family protein [Sphaerochaeta sp.]MCI2096619.1 OsmC family protein [Sphaerochaeta sp.]MCI2103564.1 OsmC family protein [Sphaerochaeta sp.]
MSQERSVRADFVPDHYQFTTPSGDAYAYTPTTGPYEYLLGALSGCLFMTFKDIAKEMHVGWEHMSFQTHGVKRDEIPTWLKSVDIHVTVTGASDAQLFTKAFEKATHNCSIYNTIAKVATMEWTVEFA